ncbi:MULTISPECIES: aminomethyl-transferring glycine dehydrogenase subunit GcvPB [Dictyoglomus]|uniref:Probable glycine dehydrogenase (decarboxylating) subunit 2 n=1 Tax=Dictyoglomus turgidum (strain DSM 6724 / Z-1310) TaxID=515635 RepID=B8E2E8_DICTD|nr:MULTISPECIES: aminomethyl-transferring glycine dehydrogenase subunit GcvPB [Dictyoglomus]ACK42792.1 Glycine dehydrogenase (decarboxylating) [Dictyoglomus turgidum DSM 6724]PNV81000.1 MAG: glycine dehydrogenase (aminomethyl-transferring) [Dictyoglomus turgidum]HBU30851.1 glycine dehydrogenase (aminomethyl-transferring) [Dictyoglomus sp.]
MKKKIPLIKELSNDDRPNIHLPEPLEEFSPEKLLPKELLREDLPLPQLSEIEVVRHFTNLSSLGYGVDLGFYPLGSCTMKYNPKINEEIANNEYFTDLHPHTPEDLSQGALEIIYKLGEALSKITGMDKFTFQPSAGAHGELTALLMIKAYLKDKGEDRNIVLVPDSAHGTNPASASMAGFETIEIPSDERGLINPNILAKYLNKNVAVLMLTNPNTLGLFERDILKIAKMVHEEGALLYYDGANLNGIMGYARPGDMGFDAVHINLHKTFSTPHGGGGPGAGPVGVKDFLKDYLPIPTVEFNGEKYYLNYDIPKTIGRVRTFYGNFLVMVKAYAYIRLLGDEGLKRTTEMAVLNANYLKEKLKEYFNLPYPSICKHEFVLSGKRLKEKGVKVFDIAKRLLDYGIHPPTIYFPLIVEEALMIEPTETETKYTLEEFVDIIKTILKEIDENPEIVKNAPHNTPVKRLNEAYAAKMLKVNWR